MIFTEKKITINNDQCKIDSPVVLYRGDYNVEVRFTIVSSPYKYSNKQETNVIEQTEASYGQLVIQTPNTTPIFSEITATKKGAITFTITAEMIDEVTEIGSYTFQIRLLDENKESRVTIPEVVDGIEIREPIATEDITDTNEVNVAAVGYAMTTAGTPEDAFDSQGNYIKTNWKTGVRITDAKLNKIDAGIDGVNKKIANLDLSRVDLTGYAKTEDIPTRVSQLTNDSNYVNTTQMNEAIANVTGQTIVEPQELDMPKVFFYGTALPTSKTDVNLTMDYISNTAKFSSFVKLKCQGNSSMSYAKKNFTINMYSDEARKTKLKKDFKGWGAQSKFCLKANYVDTTHTRNISAARIAYDMVQSRPDSPFKQQLLQCPRNGAVDGFPIKLYFNGEFYGIYTWNIPKDAWMFNMDKNNPNHVVLCAEKNTDGNSSLINSCQFRQLWTNGDGADWSVEVGTYSTDMVASFNRCINFVMTATDQEFHDNISDYFDLYSLLDYYCFSYFVTHLDGLAKNMLMVTYDGVHWGASLYDMDSIYGVNWNGSSYVSTNYQCPEQYQEQFSALWPRIERCFSAELYARYRELRQGALSLSNIIKHVEEIYDVIPDRVLADEKAKWTSLPQVNTNTMTRFRNYMRDRAVYVDAQMLEIGTKIPCTGIVLSADTLSFTTTDTQTLSVVVSPDNTTDTVTWSASPTGVVTVNNGVVTPIGNGECIITATCGSYSDTCAVTVSLPSVECTGITLDKNTLTLGVFEGGVQNENIIDVNLNENITTGREIYGQNEAAIATTTNILSGLIDVSDMDNYLYIIDIIGTTEDKRRYSFYASEEATPVFAMNLDQGTESAYLNNARGTNTYPYIKVMANSIDGNNTIDTVHLFKFSKSYLTSILEEFTSDVITGSTDVYVPVSVTPGDIVIIQGDKDYWTAMSFVNTGTDLMMNTKSSDYKAVFIPEGKDTIYFKIAPAMYAAGKRLKYKIFKPSDLIPTSEKLSEQLTATVTPTNCTQPVVWSVSPEGIVTVDNGLVTAVINGETTVTATCGTQSANFAVTVSGMSNNYVTD